MLVFASVAALRLSEEWSMSYGELIPYATPGFIAFGVCAIPAGWLADKWSRSGMIAIFFVGIGCSALFTSFAETPIQIAVGLTFIGVFAAIYHPVGLSMIVQGKKKTGMSLAVNGVFGNLGVASAALLTGILIDNSGWRSGFSVPAWFSIILGILYIFNLVKEKREEAQQRKNNNADTTSSKKKADSVTMARHQLLKIFAIIFFTTAIGGLVFQSTTFALPKVFTEKLVDIATTPTSIGWYTFIVFALAALAQLVVGYLVDRQSVKTVFTVIAALQVLFFVTMSQVSGILSLLIAIAFMLMVFGQIPINDVLVGRLAKSEWRSRAFAIRYLVTFSVMALSVPLIAWVYKYWGFDQLFLILAVAATFIFFATLLLPKAELS